MSCEMIAVNRGPLGGTGLVGFVTPLLRSELDVVAQLQTATIGLLKHLVAGQRSSSPYSVLSECTLICNTPVRNALQFIDALPKDHKSTTLSTTTPLDAVVAIIGRTDDVRLRSEATRVLSNAILVLFNPSPTSTASVSTTTDTMPVDQTESRSPDVLLSLDALKKQHRSILASEGVINALSELVRTTPHALLVNEGVVGLTLLSADSELGGQSLSPPVIWLLSIAQ